MVNFDANEKRDGIIVKMIQPCLSTVVAKCMPLPDVFYGSMIIIP